jgi:hypothetical protein
MVKVSSGILIRSGRLFEISGPEGAVETKAQECLGILGIIEFNDPLIWF